MLLEVAEEVLLLDLEPILPLVHIIDLQVAPILQMYATIAINTWKDPTLIPCMEQRSLLVPLILFKNQMFLTFLCIN